MGHGDPTQGIIVRLPKVETDPEFEAVVVPGDEDYLFGQFLRAMGLWEWQREMVILRMGSQALLMEADKKKEKANEILMPVV
jgi:hypothetical protein